MLEQLPSLFSSRAQEARRVVGASVYLLLIRAKSDSSDYVIFGGRIEISGDPSLITAKKLSMPNDGMTDEQQ